MQDFALKMASRFACRVDFCPFTSYGTISLGCLTATFLALFGSQSAFGYESTYGGEFQCNDRIGGVEACEEVAPGPPYMNDDEMLKVSHDLPIGSTEDAVWPAFEIKEAVIHLSGVPGLPVISIRPVAEAGDWLVTDEFLDFNHIAFGAGEDGPIPWVEGSGYDSTTGIHVEFGLYRFYYHSITLTLPDGRVYFFDGNWWRSRTTGLPPKPTVNPIADDDCINEVEAASSLLVSGTAVPSAKVSVSLDRFNATTTAENDGNWEVLVTGIDAMADGQLPFGATQVAPYGPPDNVSPARRFNVTKDTRSPDQSSQPDLDKWWDTGDSNSDDLTRLNRLRFRGTTNEANLTVLVQVDGETKGKGTTTNDGSWKANTTSLSEGVHFVRALTQDKCGNTGLVSSALSVEVDRTRPALTLEKKIAGDNLINAQETQAGITVSGTAEDGALVALTIASGNLVISKETTASGAWAIQLSPAELGSLPDGKIKFKARAWDVAGNFRTASRTVTKDTVIAKPSVDPITGDDVITAEERQATIYVTGLSEPGGKVTFVLEGFTKTVGVKSNGIWSVPIAKSISASLPTGVLTAKVSAVDKAGNLSATTSRTVRNQ